MPVVASGQQGLGECQHVVVHAGGRVQAHREAGVEAVVLTDRSHQRIDDRLEVLPSIPPIPSIRGQVLVQPGHDGIEGARVVGGHVEGLARPDRLRQPLQVVEPRCDAGLAELSRRVPVALSERRLCAVRRAFPREAPDARVQRLLPHEAQTPVHEDRLRHRGHVEATLGVATPARRRVDDGGNHGMDRPRAVRRAAPVAPGLRRVEVHEALGGELRLPGMARGEVGLPGVPGLEGGKEVGGWRRRPGRVPGRRPRGRLRPARGAARRPARAGPTSGARARWSSARRTRRSCRGRRRAAEPKCSATGGTRLPWLYHQCGESPSPLCRPWKRSFQSARESQLGASGSCGSTPASTRFHSSSRYGHSVS